MALFGAESGRERSLGVDDGARAPEKGAERPGPWDDRAMRITPNIWSAGQAADMSELYRAAFRDAVETDRQHYPTEGLLDFQKPLAGQVLTVSLEIHGQPVAIVNAGDEFRPNPAAGFMVNFDPGVVEDAAEYLDSVHARLVEGGRELMPLDEYPFAKRYAWVEDRFGVSWQLILTDPAGEPRPVVLPALMFCGPAQDRCAEAIDRYVSVFPGSALGNRVQVPGEDGLPTPKVVFSDARLGDTWVTAMDSGPAQDFTFTEGFSLMVAARDQEELDRWWAALSARPEAERCGWCKDEFGVSWQIVPENLGELMQKPGAYAKLMGMGKIEIAAF